MEAALFRDILARINDTFRWSEIVDIAQYIKNYKSEFTPEQLNELEFAVKSKYEAFNPRDCNTIRAIKLLYGPRHEQNLYGNKPISTCVRAKQMGLSLPDYILHVLKVPDFTITYYAGAFGFETEASELNKKLFELSKEIQIMRQERKNPETVYEYVEREAPREEHYTMEATLSPREYAILTKTPGEYPFRLIRKEGKNYVISITDTTREDIVSKLNEIERRAEEELEKERSRRKVVEPNYSNTDYENINRILCDKYTSQFPGYRCPTVLSSLSRRIAQFLYSNGLSWDSAGVDIRSIDLFLRQTPQRIYTRELADEVYRAFVSRLGQREYHAEQKVCDPEVMYPLFAELYALDILTREGLLNDEGKIYKGQIIDSLTSCGFSYDDYTTWADDSDSYFRSIGSSFRNEEEADYDRFRRMYS